MSIKLFGREIRFFPGGDISGMDSNSCPFQITRANLTTFAQDQRFTEALAAEQHLPPQGRCAASPDRSHLLTCSGPASCSRLRDMDLCDTGAYGGDTYEMTHGNGNSTFLTTRRIR